MAVRKPLSIGSDLLNVKIFDANKRRPDLCTGVAVYAMISVLPPFLAVSLCLDMQRKDRIDEDQRPDGYLRA
ncbi:hypothetical protein E4U48_002866 [Claviceps purpurea]|nr:hypothetical protein E4U48_002866 [Claviceps purpurea]